MENLKIIECRLSLFFVTCRSDVSAGSVYIHITPPEICQIPSYLSNFHEGMLRRFFLKILFLIGFNPPAKS